MTLKLESPRYGETDFGPIFNAPWVRGFFGSMHWPLYGLYPFGLTWKNTGFAAKTVTLNPHEGNVRIDRNGTVWQPLTKAIYFSFRKNCFVNAVGLSNPGLLRCLTMSHWRKMRRPFILSFTSIAHEQESRLMEARKITNMLLDEIDDFQAPIAIQWDAGCPNDDIYKDMTADELIEELLLIFSILRRLEVPLILNCNALMPLSVIRALHEHVDAFWIGNTVPVKESSPIDWEKIFKDGISPLTRRSMKLSGGYSGPEALPLTIRKVQEIRRDGIKTPIVAGNGIREPWDVQRLREAGANAVFIGSIILRPRKMKGVIDTAHGPLSDTIV